MRALVFLALAAVLGLAVSSAAAQPIITVYFDENFTQQEMDCPGPGLDTLWVVAENFDQFLTGFQFKVDLPPSMIWLANIYTPPVTIGTTPTGISMGLPLPVNGFVPVRVLGILFLWNCVDCSLPNGLVEVVDHPVFGDILATNWPTFEEVPAAGGSAVVCSRILEADLDVKPGSCPNPFNRHLFEWTEGTIVNKGGVLPVAILGTASFDVDDIDVSTILLEGVAPLSQGGGPTVDDVSAPPVNGGGCQCTDAGPDGWDDLKMKFRSLDIAAAIGDSEDDSRVLTLTGQLLNGTPFEASDCIKIVGGGNLRAFEHGPQTVLMPAVPNPFNPVTQISFSIPESQHVRLAVFDVSGRLVDVLEDGVIEAGDHTVEWDAKGVSSGVYFYQLRAGNETLVKRMTLLK
jgi:hypothetical protein